jgi:hypothetical protein
MGVLPYGVFFGFRPPSARGNLNLLSIQKCRTIADRFAFRKACAS